MNSATVYNDILTLFRVAQIISLKVASILAESTQDKQSFGQSLQSINPYKKIYRLHKKRKLQ